MTVVRRAVPNDLPSIMKMLGEYLAGCATSYPSPELPAAAQTLLSAFHETSPMLVLVAERDGELVGMACATSGRYLWAFAIQVEMKLILVRPDSRGGRAVLRLLEAIEQWAVSKGAVEISFAAATGKDDERTARMMEKRGYRRSGIDMVKPLR
jgi:N-acetylglutamate synthase-like GNAT family acetyltransferase